MIEAEAEEYANIKLRKIVFCNRAKKYGKKFN